MESNAMHPGALAPLPPELKRWNWGAFALTWIWGIANRTYFALLFFVPLLGWLIVPIVLGIKGNEWAWRHRTWQSVEQFRGVQRRWARIALIVYACAIVAAVATVVGVRAALKRSDAFELANARLRSDPRVIALLGQPIETGSVGGTLSQKGDGAGDAQLDFPVSGPKGNGTAYLVAQKQVGRWSIQRLELRLENGQRVELHDAPSAGYAAGHGPLVDAPAPASASNDTSPSKEATTPHGRRGQQLLDIAVPELRGRVNDYAKLLTSREVAALESKLAAHEKATGHQFALLTWQDLDGVDAGSFAFTVVNRWRLGRAGHNDGLLIFVSVKQRQVDIEVGTGLERVVSDDLSRSVIRDILTPAFREKRYDAGFHGAFDRLIVATGSTTPALR